MNKQEKPKKNYYQIYKDDPQFKSSCFQTYIKVKGGFKCSLLQIKSF
jgi:hypothetical protein